VVALVVVMVVVMVVVVVVLAASLSLQKHWENSMIFPQSDCRCRGDYGQDSGGECGVPFLSRCSSGI
jgi:hypothetical protein